MGSGRLLSAILERYVILSSDHLNTITQAIELFQPHFGHSYDNSKRSANQLYSQSMAIFQ